MKLKNMIKQSCNGLLLCAIGKTYHVYSSTTKMSFTLPEIGNDGLKIRTMSLAFDPNKSPYYKVICFADGYPFRVYVYSSDTGRWKSVFKTLLYGKKVNDRGVYWNGAIHWMIELLYFDIDNEKFEKMPMPPAGRHWKIHYYFGESFGRLNYAKLWKSKEGESGSADVYELKRDYSEWVLKCHVELGFIMFSVLVIESDTFYMDSSWRQ